MAADLPADASLVTIVDFDALRTDLELGQDYDVASLPGEQGSPELRATSYASVVLPQFRALTTTLDRDDPLLDAIDGSRISGAATVFDSPATAIIATDQPFDEISDELLEAGFEERDGVLVAPQEIDPSIDAVADLGDGRIVLADEEETAGAVAAGEATGPPAAALLAEVDGPVRLAAELAGGATGDCVSAYSQGEDPAEGEGSLHLIAGPDPDPELVDIDPLGPVDSTEDPVANGDRVDLDYMFSLDQAPGGIAFPAAASFGVPEVYDC